MVGVKHRILLTLAVAGDILEEIRDPLGIVSASYEQMYGFTPSSYKRHHFSSTLSYALKTGNIEKIVKGEEVYFRLTGRGKRAIIQEFPLLTFAKRRWDRKWRVLIYDVPETSKMRREALRRKINSLGFGRLQKSVYLSPFPIEREMVEFLEAHHLYESTMFMVTETIFASSEQILAEQVWNLSKINEQYESLLVRIKEDKEKGGKSARSIRSEFLEILSSDPFLPEELLPKPWLRDRVTEEIRKLSFK